MLSNETSSRTRTFFLREKVEVSSVCISQMNVTQVRARSVASIPLFSVSYDGTPLLGSLVEAENCSQ